MPIQFSCGGCGAGFSVGDGDVGRLCKCEQCGMLMRVPGRSSVNHFDTGEPPGAASDPKAPFMAPARGPIAPPAEDRKVRPSMDEALPIRQPRGTWGYLRTRASVLLFVLGALALGRGYQEMQLSRNASAEPQRLTCAQLAQQGPGSNAHVILTDFRVGINVCWYKASKDQTEWSAIWVPLAAKGGTEKMPVKLVSEPGQTSGGMWANPSGIQVLLKSARRNQIELSQLYSRREIEGTVINCIDSVGRLEMDVLHKTYPGTDFTQCWILEEGRKPYPPTHYTAMFGGGGACLVLCALCAWGGRR
jgi:hypothetical protein